MIDDFSFQNHEIKLYAMDSNHQDVHPKLSKTLIQEIHLNSNLKSTIHHHSLTKVLTSRVSVVCLAVSMPSCLPANALSRYGLDAPWNTGDVFLVAKVTLVFFVSDGCVALVTIAGN
jgi:hypothetical protein